MVSNSGAASHNLGLISQENVQLKTGCQISNGYYRLGSPDPPGRACHGHPGGNILPDWGRTR